MTNDALHAIEAGEPVLRPATLADVPEMAATLIASFEAYRDFAPAEWVPPTLEAEVDSLTRHLAERGTWAAVAESAPGAMAGHVLVRSPSPAVPGNGRVGYFGQLFVRPPWWGTGLAAQLVAAAVEAAPSLGYEALRLKTPAAQTRARRFYEREGWTLASAPAFDPAFGMELVDYRRQL